MENNDYDTTVFNNYDMVVSITQKKINDQLSSLRDQGIIRDELVIVQNIKNNDYTYEVLDSADKIPKDNSGNPLSASIAAKIIPAVDIQHSGADINFVIQFVSGIAYFWSGNGPLASLTKYDMAGWKYAIGITLDLKAVEKEDINKGIKVPKLVQDQLENFTDQMFSINHLFMDFESTDLLKFDTTKTDTGNSGDQGIQQLVMFMQFYFKDLQKKGNPYILGYAITTNDKTKPTKPEQQNIPDPLKPVGTTYSMFHDVNDDYSTLNFVLTTKGGHPGILGTPSNFNKNWISPSDNCDAKMIYSHNVLIESIFLKPFYENLKDKVHEKIKDEISFGTENTYDNAKKNDDTRFIYTIYDVRNGDNQYYNQYSVDINKATGTGVDLVFKGQIYIRKEVSKNMGVCTADAWAEGTVDWNTTVTLIQTDSGISVKTSPVTTTTSTDSGKNDCAKFWGEIGDILQILFNIVTDGFGALFANDLISSIFNTPIPGIGPPDVALENLDNSVSTTIMLPAGQVFSFIDSSADHEGNFYLNLMVK